MEGAIDCYSDVDKANLMQWRNVEGLKMTEIAFRLRRLTSSVEYRYHQQSAKLGKQRLNVNKYWTTEEAHQAFKLRTEGKSYREIADQSNRSLNAIRTFMATRVPSLYGV